MCFGGTKIERTPELPKPADLPSEVPVAPDTAATAAPKKQTDTTQPRTTNAGTGLTIPTGV
jgi:hypothetical protein